MGGLKYVFNDMTLMSEVPESDRAKSVKEILPEMSSKALGMLWDVCRDSFYYLYKSLICDEAVTRRIMLSRTSQLYDPLGLISCVTIRGKKLFQESTRLQIGWDDLVPISLADAWQQWLGSLKYLEGIHFERCLVPEKYLNGVSEIHTFCDASTVAYACVSYLRTLSPDGGIHVNIIAAKSRLAPIKSITIPRLELAAAVIGSKMDKVIRHALDIPVIGSTFWTDSKIVLAYIQNERKRFKTYVANRVSLIRQCSDPKSWKYVESKINPADVASRGCSASEIPSMWFKGPAFLSKHKCDWSGKVDFIDPISDDDPEVRRADKVCLVNAQGDCHPLQSLIDHFSSFYKLKKALCWILRVRNILTGKSRDKGSVTVTEMHHAENMLIKYVQCTEYASEVESLRSGVNVKCSSSICKLDPFLMNDMIVVGGRLTDAPLVSGSKYPIILPYDNKLSLAIVRDYHSGAHLGTEWVLSMLRNKFWIVKARKLIKQIKAKCVVCKKLFGHTMNQKMANLPPQRCQAGGAPFDYVGCDVFGPFRVINRRSEVKRYACLFTCFNSRAVHLEKLDDLSADEFINALIRFCARRGQPKQIWSDNATNFVGANNELKAAIKALDRDALMHAARRRQIEWVFNPPLASHQSGVWERQIRTLRKVMTGILGTCNRLRDSTLHTVLCEAENIVNSRPLTKCSDDVNDAAPLTPNHLLLLKGNFSYPLGKFHDGETYRKQWKHSQVLVDLFWKRWLREYLPDLQRRSKWLKLEDNLSVGDLCLIADTGVPVRGAFPLGLVKEIMIGRDGNVRSARLKTQSSTVVRPITKLINLECH